MFVHIIINTIDKGKIDNMENWSNYHQKNG